MPPKPAHATEHSRANCSLIWFLSGPESARNFSTEFPCSAVLVVELICFDSLRDSLRSVRKMPDVTTDQMRSAGYVSGVDADFLDLHRQGKAVAGIRMGFHMQVTNRL